MDFKDYYEIMGVDRKATQDDIKRAYRKLARKYHPDVSKEPDAEVRFKELGEAYEVLKDPEKRAAYDQLGADWKAGQDFQPPPGWDAGFEFSGGGFGGRGTSGFSDFFETLFGGVPGGPGRRTHGGFRSQGEDHHAKVQIDLEDAFHGASRSVTLRSPEADASGRVAMKERTLNVRIPKGVKQGQRIRLAGQGAPGMGGGPRGDLFLEVEFRPHPLYRADGRDLTLDLPIAPWEAALGATVKVPTPGGRVDLKIPAGTVSGKRMRLKGRGIPGKAPGDLYVVPQITVPPADSESAKAFYRRMAEEMAFNPRAGLGL
jgi:curved DNA-binding protein